MKKDTSITTLLIGCCPLFTWARKQEKAIIIGVNNNWNRAKTDEPMIISLRDLHTRFKVKSTVIMKGSTEVPPQLGNLNRDREMDEPTFIISLPAHGRKAFQVALSSEKSTKTYSVRVYAEVFTTDPRKGKHQSVQAVTVPGTNNVYSMVRPYGPILESELAGYCLYFNEGQTPDICGRFNKELEIKESQFYPTDEQSVRGFGDDVLRVPDSCGPGVFKGWGGKKTAHITPVTIRTGRIISHGLARVIAEIEVTGWKYQNAELDMMTRYAPYAGYRDSRIEAFLDKPIKNEVFCTGVQDTVDTVESYSDRKGFVGGQGTDWPVNDTVKYAKETIGFRTCTPQRYVKSEEKDKDNYLYTITSPGGEYLQHHTTFISMGETFSYRTPEAWFTYLREWKEEPTHPVTVKIRDIH